MATRAPKKTSAAPARRRSAPKAAAAAPAAPAKAAKKAPEARPAKAEPATAKAARPAAAAKSPKLPKPPKAAKPAKPEKQKLVRDSFTIPSSEYELIGQLKQRAMALMRPARKSELLRAGLKALASLQDAALLQVLSLVPSLKTGRPKGGKAERKA